MPTYDYRCEPCDTTFEVTRSLSDRSDVRCPSCAEVAKRVFGPVGVVFKGSGFHNTDYRKTSGGESAPESQAPACDSTSPECSSCPVKKTAASADAS